MSGRIRALESFAKGLAYALADDGKVGTNDAAGVKKLAKAAGLGWIALNIDKIATPYQPPAVKKTRKDSGYGAKIIKLEPGTGPRFNADKPEVVLGRPEGAGAAMGSLHVMSLGKRGRITLELGRAATRGLVVFENAFMTAGRVANPEPATVEASADGQTWYLLKGQAGLAPVYANSQNRISARSAAAGGDRFSFAASGIPAGTAVKFVRITDLGANFDLDAVYGF